MNGRGEGGERRGGERERERESERERTKSIIFDEGMAVTGCDPCMLTASGLSVNKRAVHVDIWITCKVVGKTL
jgi:hypothetical protein